MTASIDVYDAMVELRPRSGRLRAREDGDDDALDAAEERDARELRGEPPSMEGWVLW